MNPAFFGISLFPSSSIDTWLTIGDSYSDAAGKTPGLDLSSGFSGSSLSLGGSNSDVQFLEQMIILFVFLMPMVMYY